jgi:hypothetical protein
MNKPKASCGSVHMLSAAMGMPSHSSSGMTSTPYNVAVGHVGEPNQAGPAQPFWCDRIGREALTPSLESTAPQAHSTTRENLRAGGAGKVLLRDNRRCRSLSPVTSTTSATRSTMELLRTEVNPARRGNVLTSGTVADPAMETTTKVREGANREALDRESAGHAGRHMLRGGDGAGNCRATP